MSQAVVIFCQRFCQRLLANHALIEDQFFHGCQAVAEVGNPHLQARHPVVLRAALLDAFCSFDAVIHQRGTQNIVHVLFEHGVDHVFNLNRLPGVVTNLAIPISQHLFEVGKVTFRQRMLLRQEHLAAGGIAAAFHRRQHHAGRS
ncbi:Uncharacterised protein [Kluyvera cryocrescens]|uniref:Uncharacterized protein n=1 Tax=Kluyvera cryocrescens TaxID=580 RepID=A0A485D4J2_KLUCR|nr:Uncharacterised protein [Kluyvera cryocrescens]